MGRRCQAGAAKVLQTVLHQLNQQAILACHRHVIRLRRRSPQPRGILPGVQREVAAYRQDAGGAAGAVQGLALLQAGVQRGSLRRAAVGAERPRSRCERARCPARGAFALPCRNRNPAPGARPYRHLAPHDRALAAARAEHAAHLSITSLASTTCNTVKNGPAAPATSPPSCILEQPRGSTPPAASACVRRRAWASRRRLPRRWPS